MDTDKVQRFVESPARTGVPGGRQKRIPSTFLFRQIAYNGIIGNTKYSYSVQRAAYSEQRTVLLC